MMAVVVADGCVGDIIVTAIADDIKGCELTIKAEGAE